MRASFGASRFSLSRISHTRLLEMTSRGGMLSFYQIEASMRRRRV